MIDDLKSEIYEIIHDEDQAELCCKYLGQIEMYFRECNVCYTVGTISKLNRINERYVELSYWRSYKSKCATQLKEQLKEIMEEFTEHNKELEHPHIRQLSETKIRPDNVISVFESTLTRVLSIPTDTLTDAFMVVKVYYYSVIEDLILNGFMYNGEKYRFFTSSAGQIRTKRTVFIKESLWEQYENTLSCGLSLKDINQQGGINVNKYLAYLALCNSATDWWEDFDIDRCIVVPDFETAVHGEVDHIDEITYTCKREEMDIDIEHTDGCGMILPSLSSKNFMIRMPWMKGLLAVFDFRKFIDERGCSPLIKDVYGDIHNVIDEDIQIIMTKSQFKMWNYFDNWQAYKDAFKKYNCQAGTCKREEDYIKPAHINYQMLQTLTDITDDEIELIARPATETIDRITKDISGMLDVMGATKDNQNRNYLQEALYIYPELLVDDYCKEKLKQLKRSLVDSFYGGKLPVKGKYTFIVPDLFAACQYWFENQSVPEGLLQNGEVSCRLYKKADKLDCLRAPHLYREHAVRNNIFNDDIEKWFVTDAVYTSSFDMISRILQFDRP